MSSTCKYLDHHLLASLADSASEMDLPHSPSFKLRVYVCNFSLLSLCNLIQGLESDKSSDTFRAFASIRDLYDRGRERSASRAVFAILFHDVNMQFKDLLELIGDVST